MGGMAEVYVAKTRGLGGFEKLVAIKLVHPHLSADSHFVQMLIDEAKILVLLTHANIAQVFDLGCIDGTYYIAMEFVEGLDVHGLQKACANVGEHPPVAVCCYVASEVLNGLDYAHRKRDSNGKALNLVHRDVSPQNVLISQAGEVKLVDFGIAKSSLRGEGTEVGVIKGKYYYMSPEQAWADPMDRRSDIFSTGIVLYEMLTGRMLYSAQSIPDLISKVREAEIVPPHTLRQEVPPALSDIVVKALAREPDARFQSALDMGEALRDFLYEFAPSFNAGRLAQYLSDLVDAEARIQRERSDGATTAGLARLTRDEFVLGENSVIFKLSDGVLATRNELLPNKQRRIPASVAPTTARGHRNGGDHAPPSSLSPFGDTAPTTEITDLRDSRRISTWPLGEFESDADAPTKLWAGPEMQSHLPRDEASSDSGPVLQEARRKLPRERPFVAMVSTGPSQTDTTGLADTAPTGGLAHDLPPASDGTEPVTVARGPSLGQRLMPPPPPYGTPALVPPPGADAAVGTIPPSPLVPDFGSAGPMFHRRARRRMPWLQIGIGVIFALLGMIAFQLTRPTAIEPTLEIVSVPVGARVEVNGTAQQGATPIKLTGLEGGGTYELRVSLPGYVPWVATYRASPGTVQHIAVLRPIMAELRVASVPTGARIWMDDVSIGRTPLTVSSLPVGRRVRLRAASGSGPEMRKEVIIREANLRPTVTFRFPPAGH